jgi:hypothetical protein
MKKVTVISLVFCLSVSALPKGYVSAFFKVTRLFEHYHEHQQTAKAYSFLEFLSDHYFGQHSSEDPENHDNLPFHNSDTSVSLPSFAFLLPSMPVWTFAQYDIFVKKNILLYTQSPFFRSYFHDIWQPPRV